jgi:hypothetical protein
MLIRFVIGLIVVILMGGMLFPLEPVRAQSAENPKAKSQKPLTFGEKEKLQEHMNKALLNASNGWMDTLQQAGCTYSGATTYLKNPKCDPDMASDEKKKKDLAKIAKALFHEMGVATSGRCGKKNPENIRFSDFVCSGIVPHKQKLGTAVSTNSKKIEEQVQNLQEKRNILNKQSSENYPNKNQAQLTFTTKKTITRTKLISEFSPLCLDCYVFETVPVPNPIVYKRYHTALTVPHQFNNAIIDYVQVYMSNRLTEKENKGTLIKLKKIMAQKCTIEADSGICVYVYYDAKNTTTLNNAIQLLKSSAVVVAAADVGVTTWKAVRAYKGTKCFHPDCAAFVTSLLKLTITLGLTYLTTQEGYNIVERVFFKRA